jgi:hypothetical protein
MIVPDFLLETPEDAVICPRQGLIARHLLAMTTPAEGEGEGGGGGVHLSRYITEQAGSCDLFPLSYQASGARRVDPNYVAPQKELAAKQDAVQSTVDSSQKDNSSSLDIAEKDSPTEKTNGKVTKTSKKKRNSLLMKILTTVLRKDASVIDDLYTRRYIPIFPRKPVFRDNISNVIADSEHYVVCDALVGETVFLVIQPDIREISFLFSNLSVHKTSLPENADEREELVEWMTDMMSGGMSVFVGELSKAAAGGQYAFFCLDVVLLNGMATSASASASGEEGEGGVSSSSSSSSSVLSRMSRVNGWLFSSPLDDINLSYNSKPLLFKCKEYFPVSQLPDLARHFSHHNEGLVSGCVVSSPAAPEYEACGLVFTNVNTSVFDYDAFKWQPALLYTVDVSVSLADIFTAMQEESGKDAASSSSFITVLGEYKHESPRSQESVAVTIARSAIPREMARIFASCATCADLAAHPPSCLVACTLRANPALAGEEERWVASRFYALCERRVFSTEDINSIRKLHLENVDVSELVL